MVLSLLVLTSTTEFRQSGSLVVRVTGKTLSRFEQYKSEKFESADIIIPGIDSSFNQIKSLNLQNDPEGYSLQQMFIRNLERIFKLVFHFQLQLHYIKLSFSIGTHLIQNQGGKNVSIRKGSEVYDRSLFGCCWCLRRCWC